MNHIDDEKLALFAGGDLSGDETAAVERHIAECSRCLQTVRELHHIRDIADRANTEGETNREEREPSGGFTDRVMAKIAKTREEDDRARRLFPCWRYVSAAAAAVLIAALFWSVGLDEPSQRETERTAEQVPESRTARVVDAGLLRMLPVRGPYPVSEEPPANLTGICIIMRRGDSDAGTFTVEYIGTADGGGALADGLACLGGRDIARDDLYYLIYPMPVSSQREQVAQVLIQAYKPYCSGV